MTKNDAVERAIELMSRPIDKACEFIDETDVMPINRIERENLVKTLQALQTSRPDADRLAALDALESCRVSFNEDMSLEILAGNLRNLIWNHHGTIRAALKSGDKGREAENLAAMLRRMIWAAKKETGDTGMKVLAGKASELLKLYGLEGSPLRDASPPTSEGV